MSLRILAFMRAFPGARVWLPPAQHLFDPWIICSYSGVLQPGMSEWLAKHDMKAVYSGGDYLLIGLYNPDAEVNLIRRALPESTPPTTLDHLLEEAGLRR